MPAPNKSLRPKKLPDLQDLILGLNFLRLTRVKQNKAIAPLTVFRC